ncbi:prevent-host-death protein [Paracraurococcus lichenis]|uniref:Prevent-host-death protein n=1 Tax=Paracraurococcus lichenis TaxID=3064888 RepID=A0ABT9DT73_9PROT|nr:prevent-host-death protein [Paracraurococcus sp. LOR1-02]MDO9707076.1 prevent-host-death protein [Paracraurococcus sp. LOR1-02]
MDPRDPLDPTEAGTTRKVGVRDLRGNLAAYLQEVQEGFTILVTARDRVVAELRPPAPPEAPRRQPGGLRGRLRPAPDFDTLPPDLLAAMEGEEG